MLNCPWSLKYDKGPAARGNMEYSKDICPGTPNWNTLPHPDDYK